MLYDDSRWEKLVQEFKKNNYEIFNLTLESLLVMTLQVGLSALKTPACYQDVDRNINCPTCSKDTFGVLAEKLPNSHHLTSCLVCRISGDLMNEDNVPLALPNGYVYSSKALNQMAGKNGGTIVCPRTGDVFTISQCKKLYIS
jgi:macrophage erythroblast attacher